MAAFRDDMPLIAGVNDDWDEHTTGTQIMRPDWDFLPIRMRTMHHLPQIFFDTLRPERPDCPVLVPSSFSVLRDKVIAQDIYTYEPCGLPTGNFMPAEKAQIRLMTWPNHAARMHSGTRPSHARTGVLQRLKFIQEDTVPHPFPLTLLEYRDAKVVFEVDDWFNQLPQAVQHYLLPLQSKYTQSTPSGMRKTCAT